MNGFSSFPGNLVAILVYYLEVGDVGFGMLIGHTVLMNCTGYVTAVFTVSILQTSAGLSFVGKVTISFWTGPFVDSDLCQVWWDFIFGVQRYGFKGVGSFEDDLHTGKSEDFSHLEVNKNIFISVPYVPALSKELRRSIVTSCQVSVPSTVKFKIHFRC